jgi:hypothetical protein
MSMCVYVMCVFGCRVLPAEHRRIVCNAVRRGRGKIKESIGLWRDEAPAKCPVRCVLLLAVICMEGGNE